MATSLFQVDRERKTLAPLQHVGMEQAGLQEVRDLESWLVSAGKDLFGRRVLWIARQDRASADQRSDLLGVDSDGDLVVAELKRGQVTEDAVSQVLSYAAEYSTLTAAQIAELFASHSAKQVVFGLVQKADSAEDAQSKIRDQVGGTTEINESQILLIVGEDFSPRTLSICDFLNTASGEASFSIECWRYSVFKDASENAFVVIEQVLPPPSVREAVDEKREASKSRKRLRNPQKIEFIRSLMDFMTQNGFSVSRNPGQSYAFQFRTTGWTSEYDVWCSAREGKLRLLIPDALAKRIKIDDRQFAERRLLPVLGWQGHGFEFTEIDPTTLLYDKSYGDQLISAVEFIGTCLQPEEPPRSGSEVKVN